MADKDLSFTGASRTILIEKVKAKMTEMYWVEENLTLNPKVRYSDWTLGIVQGIGNELSVSPRSIFWIS